MALVSRLLFQLSPRIVVFSQDGSTDYRFLASEVISVGRHPNNHIQIPCLSVSLFHLEIRPERTGFTLIDLGSTNGTFVNGQPVTISALQDGDVIFPGGLAVFHFSLVGENHREERKRLFDTAPVALPG